ncbi:MAG: 30S ribosomal protein S3 [archaeon]
MNLIEKYFIKEAKKEITIREFLKKEKKEANIINVQVKRTTTGTRIIMESEKPGLLIGKGGKSLEELAKKLEEAGGVKNPEIEVKEVDNPNLNATVVANWIKKQLEFGKKPKMVLNKALESVMSSGAQGCEIYLKGKLQGKGAQAQKQRVIAGYMKKAGQQTEKVDKCKTKAILKQGIIGIYVAIVKPDVEFPDKIDVHKKISDKIGNTSEKGN